MQGMRWKNQKRLKALDRVNQAFSRFLLSVINYLSLIENQSFACLRTTASDLPADGSVTMSALSASSSCTAWGTVRYAA